ncbi:MAG: RHS repeat-associated core domain-containing protein, partial [Acidobacteria bacterium]
TIRKQFTGYERDKEVNLDFAEARYYNSAHGRFTTTDPLLSTGEPDDPQTWHRYAYALNNPLFYTDPTGMYVCKGTKDQCEQFAKRLAEAKDYLKKIEEKYGKDSKQYKKAEAAVNAYGEDETGKKTNNGVIVTFDLKKSGGKTTAKFDNKTGKLVGHVTVRFNANALDSDSSQALVAHEGSHVNDFKTVGNRNDFFEEFDADTVQSIFLEAQVPDQRKFFTVTTPGILRKETKYDIWNPSWEGPDKETLRSNAIKDYLAVPIKQGGKYELTPPKRAAPQRRKN